MVDDRDARIAQLEAELQQSREREVAHAAENAALAAGRSEALEQQTATAAVPADLAAVLNTIAESAARVLHADDSIITLIRGDHYRPVAGRGTALQLGMAFPIVHGTVSGRAILTRDVVHVEDMRAVAETEFPVRAVDYLAGGDRSVLAVPLLRDDTTIGAIVIRRFEVRRFTDDQITRLRSFADQAVIALENRRLFEELTE